VRSVDGIESDEAEFAGVDEDRRGLVTAAAVEGGGEDGEELAAQLHLEADLLHLVGPDHVRQLVVLEELGQRFVAVEKKTKWVLAF